MTKTFSTYLDLFRFLAALTVMLAHLTFPEFVGDLIEYQGDYAGAGVVAFFILSGYVIAYVSAEKETDLRSYGINRLARIYSVALPALLLTMLLDLLHTILGSPHKLPIYQYEQLWKYLPVFLTFTSEVGPIRESVLTNGVFWSLSYEVWYYITFAVAFYLTGWQRNTLLLILVPLIGIRILLFFPLWLAGVGIYYLHRTMTVSETKAKILFYLSIAGFFLVRAYGIDAQADQWVNSMTNGFLDTLRHSQHFPGHYIIGACLALNIFSARYCHLSLITIPVVSNTIRYCAGFTFAIYLAHVPLRNFFSFVIGHQPGSMSSLALLLGLMLLGSWGFGFVSERRKDWWRKNFALLLSPRKQASSIPP